MHVAPGTRLGAYEILSLVGAGGMGEVYRALDTRLDRVVAIKVLSPELSVDAEARQRFEREARTISKLDHPNICSLFDIGRAGDVDYLVMQYLEGETLAQRLRRGALPVPEALQYATEVARALTAAHQRGIVHRDLKPGNVMLTPAGAKLLDFGLAAARRGADDASAATTASSSARESTGHSALTRRGIVFGTLPYMAPERLTTGAADARSDIFAFGAVLFEMVTGRRAFTASSDAGVVTAILEREPPPLWEVRASAPPRLNRIVRRCLAKQAAERWQTADELVRELTHLTAADASHWPMTARLAGIGVAVVLALAFAVPRIVPSATPAPVDNAAATTLAVLPFDTDSGEPAERAYWSGLTQAIAATLADVPAARHLHVVSPADVSSRRARSAADARIELGATRALHGTVRTTRGGAQVDLVLIDTASARPVRTGRVVVDHEDAAGAESQVLNAVLGMLDVTLTARERARLEPPRAAPGAYDFYLQALGYMQDYDRPEQLDTAIAVFEQALKRDPNHAPAYAGLGQAFWRRYESTRDVTWAETARRSCERALGLDETEAAPHLCLGTVENGVGRYEKAVEEFGHALEREPENEVAHLGLAAAYQRLGDMVAAERTYRRAIELRPNYWAGYSRLGAFYYAAGRYAEAEQMFRQVLALSPDSWRAYSNLGGLLYVQGRMADAITAFEKSMSIRPNYQAASNLGTLYYFQRRDYRQAAKAFEQALAIDDGEHLVWGNYADALHWAGEKARARAAYARAAALAEARRAVNPRDPSVLVALAGYQAALDGGGRSAAWLEDALAMAPGNAQLMFNAAVIYEHRLANRDRALYWLERAVARGHPWTEVDSAPGLAAMRDDARFVKLRESRRADRRGERGG